MFAWLGKWFVQASCVITIKMQECLKETDILVIINRQCFLYISEHVFKTVALTIKQILSIR